MSDAVTREQAGGRVTARPLVAITLAVVGVKVGMGIVLAWVFATGRGDELSGAMSDGSLVATLVQIGLYLAVAAMVFVPHRAGVGFAAAYVGYATAAIFARGDIGPWEVMALATGVALMVALLALWAAGADRLRAARRWASVTPLLAGVTAGLVASLALYALA